MDRISEIVSVINASISEVFLQCKVYGIAERVRYGDKIAYFQKRANEVQCGVDIDDSNRAIVFHLIRGVSSEQNSQLGFGSNPSTTETYTMTLVVFCSNIDNLTTSKRVADLVKYQFPNNLGSQKRTEIGARKAIVSITSTSIDKTGVWEDVFANQKNNLADEYILFSIDYQVVLDIDNTCILQTCEKV